MQTIGLSSGSLGNWVTRFGAAIPRSSRSGFASHHTSGEQILSRNIKSDECFLKNITQPGVCECLLYTRLCCCCLFFLGASREPKNQPKKTRWARTQNEQGKRRRQRWNTCWEFESHFPSSRSDDSFSPKTHRPIPSPAEANNKA